jgi:probable rRNA maturation factor
MRGRTARIPVFELSIREEGRKLPVPKKQLEELTALTFQVAEREPGDVSLVVSDDDFIAALNAKYLDERGPTDVLSFPLREGPPRAGSPKNRLPRRGLPGIGASPAGQLGDIVISIDTADLQARAAGKNLAEEFRLLYLHGLLHLLGFTHDAEADGARMSEMQQSILSGGEIAR